WHGLRHSSTDKKLIVRIEEYDSSYLRMTIEDNGVGRTKAKELNASRLGTGHSHTSKGLALCSQRIELLQKQYPRTRMEIVDLYDESGKASGTCVSILLPVVPKR
ncbi:MAG TPA: ATP-binding protein, partial [Saprospiraceae bacterium]|nr:ATP-binding protein [Saprospiraceae bacterium]